MHEPVGDDVEQEAAEELVDRELHDFDAVAVGIVGPRSRERASADDDRVRPYRVSGLVQR
jgi:hypothetical protein